jgi:transcriptional regulator with XRE-family HTH domain
MDEPTIGPMLRSLRRKSGRSQKQQAELLSELAERPVTRNEVSRWENESRLLTPYWQRHTANSFGVAKADLERAVSAARIERRRGKADSEEVDEPVRRRDFIGAMAAIAVPLSHVSHRPIGPRIGDEDAQRLYSRTARLRRLDNFMGGADTYHLYAAELSTTTELIKTSSYRTDVGSKLKTLVGEQAQLAGWAAFDAGQHAAARGHYMTSLTAAEEAGDAALAGNALAFLAYQMTATSQNGVGTAAASWEKAENHATPKVRALLLERLAWSHAVAGQARETDTALAMAREALHHDDDRPEPDWVFWVDDTEMEIMAGRCWTELRRPTRAVPILESVLSSFDDTHARDKALYMTWLATAYLDASEVEQAAMTAERALDLATGVASVRPIARIEEVSRRLNRHRDTPEVSALLDRLAR